VTAESSKSREDERAADPGAHGPWRVKVLFPLPLEKAYDYLAPSDLPPGTWVEAPFGGRSAVGVVWPGEPEDVPSGKLKAVTRILPTAPLAPDMIDFIAWTASYTMFPLGAVLRLVIRSGDALEPPAGAVAYVPTGALPSRASAQRSAALAAFGDGAAPMTARAIAEKSGASEAVIRGLAKAGALRAVNIDPDPPFAPPSCAAKSGLKLSADQERAADHLRALIKKREPILLDGVTGSGKTEVYLEAAAAVLGSDPEAQTLILLPEIALTLAFLKRIERRFAAAPAAWHSDMTAAARRRVWRRVNEGQARIVVGARSALFLPYRKLSLIVVDEEHEGAYKQEDGVIYHARDLAVARGARAGFPVILASATPSLESVVNVDQGRYSLVRLASRYGAARLPKVALIDMRREGPEEGGWLSPALVEAVGARLSAGEQTLLFINRRGYAPLTLCRRCGHRMKSPHADAFLVEHRFEGRLVCHLTGYSTPKPAACPQCKAVNSLAACGPGVERVAEEAARRWPGARRAVLSSDTAQSPAKMRAILDAMTEGEIDILIATQMAAKGHHFPRLTLVGVVDADMGLAGGDLRAAERTYQLLSQVAGRAGREDRPGEAMLQTYLPETAVFRALENGDRDAFLEAEARGREDLAFPPYGRLAAIILRSTDERALKNAGEAHRAALIDADGVVVWGPAPAPVYRIRGEARLRFLVKTRRDVNIQAFIAAWLARVKTPNAVRRTIDIDPYSFL
jgi:primosomal protein N' (replication factor Y)